jgi:hypothetical protein
VQAAYLGARRGNGDAVGSTSHVSTRERLENAVRIIG